MLLSVGRRTGGWGEHSVYDGSLEEKEFVERGVSGTPYEKKE